jgi:hypothetical protein
MITTTFITNQAHDSRISIDVSEWRFHQSVSLTICVGTMMQRRVFVLSTDGECCLRRNAWRPKLYSFTLRTFWSKKRLRCAVSQRWSVRPTITRPSSEANKEKLQITPCSWSNTSSGCCGCHCEDQIVGVAHAKGKNGTPNLRENPINFDSFYLAR